MSDHLKNNESWLAKSKRMFLEQLWLILLLAPLLIIALLITEHYQPATQKLLLSKRDTNLGLSIEITSAELAVIVAKPIGELLTMDVYIDYKQASRTNVMVTSLDGNNIVENKAYNRVIAVSKNMQWYAKN